MKGYESVPQLQRLLGACSLHTSSTHYQVPSPSVADPIPGSGAFLTPGSGMGKKSGSGSGMNNPGYISKSFFFLETIFWVKILKFFDADPGSGMEKFGSGIRNTE